MMYGFGLGVGVPSGVLWSKNSSCWGVDSLAMVGMICTQFKRHFLRVPPRDFDPARARNLDRNRGDGLPHRVGRRPVGVLAVVGWQAGGVGGFEPQPEASNISRITISRRTR